MQSMTEYLISEIVRLTASDATWQQIADYRTDPDAIRNALKYARQDYCAAMHFVNILGVCHSDIPVLL